MFLATTKPAYVRETGTPLTFMLPDPMRPRSLRPLTLHFKVDSEAPSSSASLLTRLENVCLPLPSRYSFNSMAFWSLVSLERASLVRACSSSRRSGFSCFRSPVLVRPWGGASVALFLEKADTFVQYSPHHLLRQTDKGI